MLLAPAYVFAATGVFSDIPAVHENAPAIVFLKEKGVVNGYKDPSASSGQASFKPDRTITRAEFVKILITLRDPSDNRTCKVPTDVKKKDWFYQSVCLAIQDKIVQGGKDGLFRPSDNVTLADASVMLARAYGLNPKETKVWYEGAIRALASKNAIPGDVQAAFMRLTRAQVAEMLWRLQNDVTDRGAVNVEDILGAQCSAFEEGRIDKVDMQEVQRVWLGWVNDARAQEGLPPYRMDRQLIRTAWLWSDRARSLGTINHKRDGQSAYYDYKMVGNWFSSLGLDFKNVKGSTYTENIGWGMYRCKKDDCTGDMINAIRSTFDFFMSEKGKASAPHYNSIVNPSYASIGMGVTVDGSGKYYLTVHYGTQITSDPDPICR